METLLTHLNSWWNAPYVFLLGLVLLLFLSQVLGLGHHDGHIELHGGDLPFAQTLLAFSATTGFLGLVLNRFAGEGVFSAVCAAAAGLASTRVAGRLFKPPKKSPPKHALLGSDGVVCSLRLDASHGEIRVKNLDGEEVIVHGRTEHGVMPRHTPVVLVDYDRERDVFLVADFSVLEEKS